MKPLYLIPLLLVASACEPTAPADLGIPTDPNITVRSYFSPDEGPKTMEQRQAMSDASRFALRETKEILSTSTGWHEADERLQSLADGQTDPLRKRFVESVSAYRMLRTDVLGTDESPEALEATGRYVEALVQHQSLETPLIADALSRLVAHWPTDRVVRTARAAVSTVEAHAVRNANCDGCSPEKAYAVLASATRENRAVYDVRSVEAVEALRALASGAE